MSARLAALLASDDALIAQCEVDRYRASGPGGQHRNKTESAVRLRHKPSGVSAIGEDSRSQAENKVHAVRRLRSAIALEVREPVALDAIEHLCQDAKVGVDPKLGKMIGALGEGITRVEYGRAGEHAGVDVYLEPTDAATRAPERPTAAN